MGTLYGVTGDNKQGGGGPTAESLFIVNTADATSTPATPLGNGLDGEAIGFNPVDGLIYHGSGNVNQNVDEIFETIDPASGYAITNVPLSGGDYQEALALSYCYANGLFMLTDNGGGFWTVSPAGVVSYIRRMNYLLKGLAFLDNGVTVNSPAVPVAAENK